MFPPIYKYHSTINILSDSVVKIEKYKKIKYLFCVGPLMVILLLCKLLPLKESLTGRTGCYFARAPYEHRPLRQN